MSDLLIQLRNELERCNEMDQLYGPDVEQVRSSIEQLAASDILRIVECHETAQDTTIILIGMDDMVGNQHLAMFECLLKLDKLVPLGMIGSDFDAEELEASELQLFPDRVQNESLARHFLEKPRIEQQIQGISAISAFFLATDTTARFIPLLSCWQPQDLKAVSLVLKGEGIQNFQTIMCQRAQETARHLWEFMQQCQCAFAVLRCQRILVSLYTGSIMRTALNEYPVNVFSTEIPK